MQTTGPYSLALGVPISPADPVNGVWSDQLQVQNYSTFLLTVVAAGATWTISPFMAKTIPLTPLPPTITPSSNPSGAAANKLTLVWLLNGEVSPTPDGALTQPAVDISGSNIEVTIDTSGGAVDIQSAPNTSVNSVAPSQVIVPLTTYSGTTYGPTLFNIGPNVHALGLALNDFTLSGDYQDIVFDITGGQTLALLYHGRPFANRNISLPGSFLIIPCDGVLDTSVQVVISSPSTAAATWSMSGFTAALPPYVPEAVPGTVANATSPSSSPVDVLPGAVGRMYVLWSVALFSSAGSAGGILYVNNSLAEIILPSGGPGAVTQSFPRGLLVNQVTVEDLSSSAGQATTASVTYSYV